jgi:hypothetical protein
MKNALEGVELYPFYYLKNLPSFNLLFLERRNHEFMAAGEQFSLILSMAGRFESLHNEAEFMMGCVIVGHNLSNGFLPNFLKQR